MAGNSEKLTTEFYDGLGLFLRKNLKRGDAEVESMNEPVRFYTSKLGSVDLGEPQVSFADELFALAESKKISKTELCTRAGISRQMLYKIRGSEEPGVSKRAALALVVGVEATKPEADSLLKKAGFSFSDSDLTDMVVEYFIEKEVYDIDAINEVLYSYNRRPLGSI